jgi:hypothetical protein
MSEATTPEAFTVLKALLRGEGSAAHAVANTLRAEAFGFTTFGRTDTLDLFATHPLRLSAAPWVLSGAQALAVLDTTEDGRSIGAFADLADGVIARLWVVAAAAGDALVEPAVPVARDDFMSQLRVPCHGDAIDHPGLDAGAWPGVLSLGASALAASDSAAASSSHAVVMRAFSAGPAFAVLYSLRVQEHGAPRRAHRRLALATAQRDAAGSVVHSRLAVSDALPVAAAVSF